MIKQLIQTETKVLSSNTVIDCGNGDVAKCLLHFQIFRSRKSDQM